MFTVVKERNTEKRRLQAVNMITLALLRCSSTMGVSIKSSTELPSGWLTDTVAPSASPAASGVRNVILSKHSIDVSNAAQ